MSADNEYRKEDAVARLEKIQKAPWHLPNAKTFNQFRRRLRGDSVDNMELGLPGRVHSHVKAIHLVLVKFPVVSLLIFHQFVS